MKAKTRNVLIASAIAAAVGATGMAVADMGGYGAGCAEGAQMQQGQGRYGMMHEQGGRGMMGGMHGGMHGGMMGGMHGGMHEGMMGGMHGGMMGGMGNALGLSDEQRVEMSKIRAEMLPQMGELRGKLQANHEQLRALHHSGTADQAAIDKLADQKGDLIAEMIKLRTRNHARMQGLLTDEQREQMRQHRSGMGGGMMGMSPMGG